MRISVIIPTYQPDQYIWQCLRSLSRQTLSKKCFEVIIVLNGCNEPYHSTLQHGLGEYQGMNIRLIQTDKGGVSNARNIGIDTAQGDYLCFADDDDWVSPCYLEKLLECSTTGTLPVSNVIDYNEQTNEQCEGYLTRAFLSAGEKQSISLYQGRSFMSTCWGKLIPRQLVGNRRFDTRFRLGEDAMFMASISDGVSSITTVARDAIYYRRLRPQSASRSRLSFTSKALHALRLSVAYLSLYIQHPIRYNARFFLSRIAASLLKIFKKSWI